MLSEQQMRRVPRAFAWGVSVGREEVREKREGESGRERGERGRERERERERDRERESEREIHAREHPAIFLNFENMWMWFKFQRFTFHTKARKDQIPHFPRRDEIHSLGLGPNAAELLSPLGGPASIF